MTTALRIFCAILGVACFAGAAWLAHDPIGEFTGLAVTFLAVAGQPTRRIDAPEPGWFMIRRREFSPFTWCDSGVI